MPVDNLVEDLEKEGGKKIKKIKPKKEEEKKPADKVKPKREDNHLFNLVIAVVIILGIIGIVFGYTKDKLSEISQGGTEVTKALEQQVSGLQEELKNLQDKASNLEKDNLSSKNVVIDLFEKARRIPTKVNVTGWSTLDADGLSFTLSYPTTWEKVKPIIEAKEGEAAKAGEMIYLQPIGQTEFFNAVTVKADYADFAKLSINEKYEIFKDLDLIDTYTVDQGRMLYFINLDKDNNEVPTILILTEDNIYRATFNIYEKKLTNYFENRKLFEEIVSTFGILPGATEKKQ